MGKNLQKKKFKIGSVCGERVCERETKREKPNFNINQGNNNMPIS